MVILFVDLLGVRSRWHKGGRDAAEEAFQAFRNLVAYSLKGLSADQVPHGLVETDAAAITCSSVDVALDLGKKLYRATFEQTARNRDSRNWLRGAIMPRQSENPLRRSTHFSDALQHVELVLYETDLLDAIQIEKSGIKGMRLIVDKELITPDVNRKYALHFEELNFIPLKRLRNSSYPGKVSNGYLDYLWMASIVPDEMTKMERLMALRLRHSSHDAEEFTQAAATQVLFHECTAIIGSLRTRLHFQRQKELRHNAEKSLPRKPIHMMVF